MRRGITAIAALAALLIVACAPSEPPPANPLADTSTPPAGVSATPRPLPTFTSTPGATSTSPATATPTPTPTNSATQERLVAQAIDLLAEWLGMAPSDFSLHSVESVDWPSACLGVNRPDIACAEVITPGFEITLRTFGDQTEHHLHASTTGRFAWAPTFESEGTITAVDTAAGMVSYEPGRGEALATVVPGSDLSLPLAELAPGMRFVAGFDRTPTAAAVIVWLVVTGRP